MKLISAIAIVLVMLVANNAYATNYSYSYNGHDIVKVIEKRVQINPDLYLGYDGYYALGEAIDAKKQHQKEDRFDEIEAKNRELQAKIDVLIQLLGGKASPPVGGSDEEPFPPGDEPPAEEPNSLEDGVYTLLKQQCFTCHKNNANGLQLFSNDGSALADLKLSDIVNVHHRTEGIVLNDGETLMPKGKQPLSADDMKLIKRWMFERSQGE